jgi:hypothetical protein
VIQARAVLDTRLLHSHQRARFPRVSKRSPVGLQWELLGAVARRDQSDALGLFLLGARVNPVPPDARDGPQSPAAALSGLGISVTVPSYEREIFAEYAVTMVPLSKQARFGPCHERGRA